VIGRRPGWGAIALLVIGVIVLLTAGEEETDRERGERGDPPGEEVTARVVDIVDGDTIEVAIGGEIEDVRYIGVDTPESVAPGQPVECFGERASDFNERLVGGETVRLVFGAERRDRYGRLLAYVYVGSRLVNAELVRRGYATTLAIAPNTDRAGRFERLARRAGAAGRGLWGACPA
jgi:micrococcal nuclease